MTASHSNLSVNDNTLTPEEYFDIECANYPLKSIKLANYCYAKLNDKPNGIGFALYENDKDHLFKAWRHNHYMLVAHFAPTSKWKEFDIDAKVKVFLERPEGRANLPAALVHNVRIKSLFLDKKYLEALALIKQSNLHLNLSGENFSHVDFRGVNLEGTYLRRTFFEGANLQGANLKNTSLWNADFENADLRGADLTGAELDFTRLDNAVLDEKPANAIVDFVLDSKNHFPIKFNSLRKCIANSEEKNIILRAQDCIKLISLCRYDNLADNVKNLSPSFQKAIAELQKKEKDCQFILTVSMTDSHSFYPGLEKYYKPFTKNENERILLSNESKHPYYEVVKNEYNSLSKHYCIHSRYLVTEFKDNTKLIWDIRKTQDAPLAAIEYSEEDRDLLDPQQRLYEMKCAGVHAAYLNADEIVAIDSEHSGSFELDTFRVHYKVAFFAKNAAGFQKIKSESLEVDRFDSPDACTAISANQFALAYSSNRIEIWDRKDNSQDRFHFTRAKVINVAKQSWPFCNEVKENTGYHRSHHTSHHCYRKVNRRNLDKSIYQMNAHSDPTDINMLAYNREFALHALNSEELLFTQGNDDYQLIQKINFKTENVTHQLELINHVSPWLASAKTFFPLVDGQTFFVVSNTQNHGERVGLVFEPKSMAFYRVRGFTAQCHGRDSMIGVLKTGEPVSLGHGRETILHVNGPLPHIQAYLQNFNKRLDNELAEYVIKDLRAIIRCYLNDDVMLSNDDKSKWTSDLASFYGEPEVTANGLLQRNPQDYCCYQVDQERKQEQDEDDKYGDPNPPSREEWTQIETLKNAKLAEAEEQKANSMISEMKLTAAQLINLLNEGIKQNNSKIAFYEKLWKQANAAPAGANRMSLFTQYIDGEGAAYLRELPRMNNKIINILSSLNEVIALSRQSYLAISTWIKLKNFADQLVSSHDQIKTPILSLELQHNPNVANHNDQIKNAFNYILNFELQRNPDKELKIQAAQNEKEKHEFDKKVEEIRQSRLEAEARYQELRKKAKQKRLEEAKQETIQESKADDKQKRASCIIC